MICGESAGIAACLALEGGTTVQAIDPVALQTALKQAGQKLSWDPATDKAPSRDTGGALTMSKLLGECDTDRDGVVSREEWNDGKKGWEWLFPHIDTGGNQVIEPAEYEAFQRYKAEHPDWAKALAEEPKK